MSMDSKPNVFHPPILALVRDLMFSSKIRATAKSVGATVEIIRDPTALADRAGHLLLVDLNLAGSVEAAAQWRTTHNGRVIGFVSHVDAATIAHARDAGLDQILARSAFVQSLPNLLTTDAPTKDQ